MDPRRSPRFRTRFDSLVSFDGGEGAGVMTEISYAGAQLEEMDTLPPLGAKITLYVFIQPVAPFELQGNVTRVADSAFSITWDLFDEEIRRLVDDVGAVVSGPNTGT